MDIHTITLLKKKYLLDNVLELSFSKPTNFDYIPGQFVQFLVPNGEKTIPRAYSLSSIPTDDTLEFCVKLLEDGKASTMFDAMQEGHTTTIRGPRGHFTNTETRPLYLVATGVGIAPIMGIIRDELEHKKTDQEIRVLFGVRHEHDVFWEDRLTQLAAQYDTFSYGVTLSQPGNTWTGLKGRVTDHILHHLVDHHFYLCGSAAMIKDIRTILLEHGVDKGSIHFEIF